MRKSWGMIAPGLRAVAERSAAHAGGVVLVGAFAGQHGVGRALGVDPYARIAFILRTKRIAQHSGALVAQVVFAAIVCGVPFAALKQNDAQAGNCKLLGHDAARCAGADDHSIDALHEGEPFLQVVLRAAQVGGSGRPSIRQLTASRLPPWRGEP